MEIEETCPKCKSIKSYKDPDTKDQYRRPICHERCEDDDDQQSDDCNANLDLEPALNVCLHKTRCQIRKKKIRFNYKNYSRYIAKRIKPKTHRFYCLW